MAGTITWMTGFNRALRFNSVDKAGAITRDTTYYRTGVASLVLFRDLVPGDWARQRIATSPTNPSYAIALYARDYFDAAYNGYPKIGLRRAPDRTLVELRWNIDTHTMDLYDNDTLVASGTIEVSMNDWFQVQYYDSTATITIKIDGHTSISYAGTSGAVDYCYLTGGAYSLSARNKCNFDDWAIGYGGFFGDVRVEELVTDGDNAVQFLRSEGAVNSDLLDESPQSDADYVYTKTNGHADKLTLGDYDPIDSVTGVTKRVLAVQAWVRAKLDVATGDSFRIGVDSNGTVDTTKYGLAYSYEWYDHIMALNPADAAAWEEADLDALLLYYEAVLA